MTKFTVCLTRMVEKITTVEIEAADLAAAREVAHRTARNVDLGVNGFTGLDWRPGDDCTDARAYAILDAEGACIADL